MKKFLKKKDGFTGVDISISMIIILIFIPTITAMIYNINKENKNVERKSQALNFAVNVMETAKGIGTKDLTLENMEKEITNLYSAEIQQNSNTTDGIINISKDDVNYNLTITIQDYNEIDDTVAQNKAKQVKVIVTYLSGGKEQKIELSTAIS